MARYPTDFLNKLNDMTNIYDLIAEYTTLSPAGEQIFTAICPLPDHHETNGSLTVFTHSNSWCCYGCGAGSNALAFVTQVNNWNFHQAVEYLCERNGIQKPNNHEFDALFKEHHIKEGIYHMRLLKNTENSLTYLLSRGLTHETIGRWGLGANGKNRIIFPLYDRDKNILEFSMRYIIQPADKNDKYWHPSNYSDKKKTKLKKHYNKASYLYGIHLYDHRYGNYVYFCEGNLDVILAEQEGLRNCFSTFGTNFSESHLGFLQTTKKAPVFIYDGDDAGVKGMHKACNLCIDAGIKPYVVILDNQMDLADLALREKGNLAHYILNQLTPYAYYLIKEALTKYQHEISALHQHFYALFSECLAHLTNEQYKLAKSYIYRETNLLIEADQKRHFSVKPIVAYSEIEELVSLYHKAFYMLQEPYYNIFISSMRTLKEEDKNYAKAYIYQITGLSLGGDFD